MQFIHQRRLVQMFNDINYPGSRNQYAAPLRQVTRMRHFNAASTTRTNSPSINRLPSNPSLGLTAHVSYDQNIPRVESNYVVDKAIKCDPNDCHSSGDYLHHGRQTCDYDARSTDTNHSLACPIRVDDHTVCQTVDHGSSGRPTGAKHSLARPTNADQSLVRPIGADQGLTRPIGADQSLSIPADPDLSLARPTVANDRDACSISVDNCNRHRVFTIGPGFRRYIQRGLDELTMKVLIRLVMLIKVIQDDVPLD